MEAHQSFSLSVHQGGLKSHITKQTVPYPSLSLAATTDTERGQAIMVPTQSLAQLDQVVELLTVVIHPLKAEDADNHVTIYLILPEASGGGTVSLDMAEVDEPISTSSNGPRRRSRHRSGEGELEMAFAPHMTRFAGRGRIDYVPKTRFTVRNVVGFLWTTRLNEYTFTEEGEGSGYWKYAHPSVSFKPHLSPMNH